MHDQNPNQAKRIGMPFRSASEFASLMLPFNSAA
jgi:hypothetical protein